MTNKTQDYIIGELIFNLMSSIEQLNLPLGAQDEFGQDLDGGSVKYLDEEGSRRIYRIHLVTDMLEITEVGRDLDKEPVNVELTINGQVVCKAQLELLFEDENEWLYQNCQMEKFEPGPWVDEMRLAQKRLDMMLEAKNAERNASKEIQSQKKLAKRLLKRRQE